MTSASHKAEANAAGLEAPPLYGSIEDLAADAHKRSCETARWFETSEDTDPVKIFNRCFECDEFKSRKVKAPLVAVWILLQCLGLLFMSTLYTEVGRHLADYEATLAEHCWPRTDLGTQADPAENICMGPAWNLTYSGVVEFAPQGSDKSEFDFVISSDATFSFSTSSEPVTFLLGVEPQRPHPDARWRTIVKNRNGGKELPATYGGGSKYTVVSAKGIDAHDWTAHMTLLSNFRESMSIRVYVLDANMDHLEEIHKTSSAGCMWGSAAIGSYIKGNGQMDSKVFHNLDEAKLACGAEERCGGITKTTVGTTADDRFELREGQTTARSPTNETSWLILNVDSCHQAAACSVEGSWQNFNERHNGRYHRVLSWTRAAIGAFLVFGMLITGFVLHRFLYYVETGKLLSRIVVLKFVLQDFPLQICIVLYLYGWYASNGLRCQMCLFHPEHCSLEYPLHWKNCMVCFFTLMSASANQMLLQAKLRKWDPEEEMCLGCIRLGIFSISTLPFSTALFLLSHSLLHLRNASFWFYASGLPALTGWTVMLCGVMIACCDE